MYKSFIIRILFLASLGALFIIPLVGAQSIPGMAVVQMLLREIEGEEWSAHGVTMDMTLNNDNSLALEIGIKKVLLPAGMGPAQEVRLHCKNLRIGSQSIQCPDGTARLKHPQIKPKSFPIRFDYRLSGELRGKISGLPFAGGNVALNVSWLNQEWRVDLNAKNLALQDLEALLRERLVLPEIEFAGQLNIQLNASGKAGGLQDLDISVKTHSVSFSDVSGSHAGESLGAQALLRLAKHAKGWSFATDIVIQQGQLYLDPIFMAFQEDRSLRAVSSGRWLNEKNIVQFEHIGYQHAGILEASARADFDLGQKEPVSVQLKIIDARFPQLYETYLQPFAIGSIGDDLHIDGRLSAELDYRPEGPALLHLNLDGVDVEDRQKRFSLQNLRGEFNWNNTAAALPSYLEFDNGALYRIDLGPTHLLFQSQGRGVQLLQPTTIPVLDGRLRVESLEVDAAGTPAISWRFDAGLSPVSMESLTAALGWPSMSGKLSGMVPNVSYRDAGLSVGGALWVRAFDGDIVIKKLQLQNLLGLVPQLTADVEISRLDLEVLTRTFSFGKIEGRVDGHMRRLKLLNWQPVFFDARFFTPDEDRSRHRISQRAVDNITSIGGVSGALSSGLMRLFEAFSYSRIGLSCVLRDGVCEMDGVAPTKNGGYYIVKGAGLPRIDIIGYTRKVDWFELIDRLKSVSVGQGAVVQ